MSPEVLQNPRDCNHKNDIWSVGILMYYMMTKKMPFNGDDLN